MGEGARRKEGGWVVVSHSQTARPEAGQPWEGLKEEAPPAAAAAARADGCGGGVVW